MSLARMRQEPPYTAISMVVPRGCETSHFVERFLDQVPGEFHLHQGVVLCGTISAETGSFNLYWPVGSSVSPTDP